MSGGGVGAEGMVTNLPNFASTWNQIQTLKDCLCCHFCCAQLVTSWDAIVGACRAPIESPGTLPHNSSRPRERSIIDKNSALPIPTPNLGEGIPSGRSLMIFLSIPTKQFTKVFPYLYCSRRATIIPGKNQSLMKISRYSDSKVFQHDPFWTLEVRGKGHPIECKCGTIWRVPSNCRRAPSMVDQRWRTVQDQRWVQRQMLDNIIQAHAYADLRYAWSVQKYGVCFKHPFFERPSIVHLTYWLFVFESVETAQKDACCAGVSH